MRQPEHEDEVYHQGRYYNRKLQKQAVERYKEVHDYTEVARQFGCTNSSVRNWVQQEGYSTYRKTPGPTILKWLYYDCKLSTTEIAERYDVKDAGIVGKLKRKGYKLRSRRSLDYSNHLIMNPYLKQLIDGSLLGDGCMCPISHRSAYLEHVDLRWHFIQHLSGQFRRQNIKVKIRKQKNSWHCRTASYPEFLKIRTRWYPNGQKHFPDDLKLKPVSLLLWFIGDGNVYKAGLPGESVQICIKQDPTTKQPMQQKLLDLGIETIIHSYGLYFRKRTRMRFYNYMLSSGYKIPKCYHYKFPSKYCETNLYKGGHNVKQLSFT